jgi:acyl-CoA synthetase (AMP-forming)/AMP-acid ligase II
LIATRTADDEVGADLDEYLKDRLAGYKRPRLIVRVEEVRRAPNGKPDYKWARKVVLDSQEGVGSPR